MAVIRAQHGAGLHGWNVLIDVAGRGVTLSFHSGPPSEQELADAIEACERRMMAEIVAEKISEQEES